MSFLCALENGVEVIAQCGVLFLECIGVVVLLSAAVGGYSPAASEKILMSAFC
ncbi:MAG: hypothetical protein V8R75_04275 [Oscillospiraceae bacterium]